MKSILKLAATLAACNLLACAGLPSDELEEISRSETKLVLQGAISEMNRAEFYRKRTHRLHYESATWRIDGQQWPWANLFLSEIQPFAESVFVEESPDKMKERIWGKFEDKPVEFGRAGKAVNVIGPLRFQQFQASSEVHCVYTNQYFSDADGIHVSGSHLPAAGYSNIEGWYCGEVDEVLTNARVDEFIRGIGVRGTAVPAVPISKP